MFSLIHLSIGAVLLITFGAFLVQRTALARAKGYEEGRRDSLARPISETEIMKASEADIGFGRAPLMPQHDPLNPASPTSQRYFEPAVGSAAFPGVVARSVFASPPVPERPSPNENEPRHGGIAANPPTGS